MQYDHLYESAAKDAPLTEWLRPRDHDEVRPTPPPPPDGFHAALKPGAVVDVWHEAAWWPATVRRAPVGGGALGVSVEVSSDGFPALCRAFPAKRVRPRGIYSREGGWQQVRSQLAATGGADAAAAKA